MKNTREIENQYQEVLNEYRAVMNTSSKIAPEAKEKLMQAPTTWIQQMVNAFEANGHSSKHVNELESTLSNVSFVKFVDILERIPLLINSDFVFCITQYVGDDEQEVREDIALTLLDALVNLK